MNTQWMADTLCAFIDVPSVSGREELAVSFLESLYRDLGWEYELLPFDGPRKNVLVTFGRPRVIFTTHFDVVPAPDHLFKARYEEGCIHGRGANDAKGILVAMIAAARRLREQQCGDFGLLFVCEEETTGDGARAAAKALADRGVEFLVNGEPTENELAIAHKGGVGFSLSLEGVSCHSGYPELGTDAIAPLVRLLTDLYATDFGTHEVLGKATLNVGTIAGGNAANIVPDNAHARVMIRTVTSNEDVKAKVAAIVGERARLEFIYDTEPVHMESLPGFPQRVVSYCTDVPQFAPLGARCFLYGPGTIERAHTDFEFVRDYELKGAMEGYVALYEALQKEGV